MTTMGLAAKGKEVREAWPRSGVPSTTPKSAPPVTTAVSIAARSPFMELEVLETATTAVSVPGSYKANALRIEEARPFKGEPIAELGPTPSSDRSPSDGELDVDAASTSCHTPNARESILSVRIPPEKTVPRKVRIRRTRRDRELQAILVDVWRDVVR